MRPVAGSLKKLNSYSGAESTFLLAGSPPKIPLSEPDPSMVFQDNVEQTAAAGRTSHRRLARSASARDRRGHCQRPGDDVSSSSSGVAAPGRRRIAFRISLHFSHDWPVAGMSGSRPVQLDLNT